ncbi:14345_t:CDS:2 [Funneliformis geosporum]|uniref:14345_t:CDS:1 n=1 Tax=Funneliformis geosporum TaxID=1117311 RepID=A0A9W4WJG6_9GLOM|nr:14345_t:CDS:2 [Funneliformis geosporum]
MTHDPYFHFHFITNRASDLSGLRVAFDSRFLSELYNSISSLLRSNNLVN